jgi:hypothetical protein
MNVNQLGQAVFVPQQEQAQGRLPSRDNKKIDSRAFITRKHFRRYTLKSNKRLFHTPHNIKRQPQGCLE